MIFWILICKFLLKCAKKKIYSWSPEHVSIYNVQYNASYFSTNFPITIYFDFQEIKVKEAHSGHLGSILQGGFGQFFSVDIGT